MTKFLLRTLLLAFVAWGAQAAAPSVTCTPSRTSGTAPLNVILDCSSTTDADTTKPFHDLFYEHTFGDRSAGTWAYGARAAVASKNYATGPIAAHVYETAGTYVITSQVSDGTNLVRATNTITVANPDTTYAGTATWCIFNTAVGTGCPAGATERPATSDFDAEITAGFGTTKRILLKRGDTFTASAISVLNSAGPNTIGAYGSGALPVINVNTGVCALRLNGTNTNDLRVMDLDFVGTGVVDGGSSESAMCLLTASSSGVTVLRVTSRAMGAQGIEWASGLLGMTNSVLQDSTITTNLGGATANLRFISGGAVLGNTIGPIGGAAPAEFTMRVQRCQKCVIAHNTISTAASGKNEFTLRADVHSTDAEDTFDTVVAHNRILNTGSLLTQLFAIENGSGTDERLYRIIAEGNWITVSSYAGAGTCSAAKLSSASTHFRNNLIDTSGWTGCDLAIGLFVRKDGDAPNPDANHILNNTFYSSAAVDLYAVWLNSSTVTNSVIKNNLAWYDLGTSVSTGTDFLQDNGTGTVAATNSTQAETKGTDPLFDTPLSSPVGFRIGTTSYAADGGTAIFPASNDDFLGCDDNTANERIGAFVPRVRARCRGAAGP